MCFFRLVVRDIVDSVFNDLDSSSEEEEEQEEDGENEDEED